MKFKIGDMVVVHCNRLNPLKWVEGKVIGFSMAGTSYNVEVDRSLLSYNLMKSKYFQEYELESLDTKKEYVDAFLNGEIILEKNFWEVRVEDGDYGRSIKEDETEICIVKHNGALYFKIVWNNPEYVKWLDKQIKE